MNNYPTGSANDPSAPWNEGEREVKEFEVTVNSMLQKKFDIITDEYLGEDDDAELLYADAERLFLSEHCKPSDLLKTFADMLKSEIESQRATLKMIKEHGDAPEVISHIEEEVRYKEFLRGESLFWTEVDTEVDEVEKV